MKVYAQWIFCIAALAAAGGARADVAASPATPVAPLTFDDKGAQVGEQLPDLALLTLDNEPVNLQSQLQDTTLLVTSSFTCPKSRENFPALAELAKKYGKHLHIVILYVIEAHPAGDPSPYRSGKEDVTPQNQRDGILRRQPTKIEKRLALANEFSEHFASKIPILVDPMDNFGWKSVGAGPNMAIVLSSDRKVLARQGWFNAKTLTPEIDRALARPRPFSAGFLNPADKAIADELRKRDVYETQLVDGDHLPLLKELLAKDPALVHYVSSYMQKGDSGGETLLQSAAQWNDPAAAKLLLEKGADPEQFTPRKPFALYMAAAAGNDDVVALLISHVKHIDLTHDNGPTALQAALYDEHPKSVELLHHAGARENFFTHVARGDAADVAAAIEHDASIAGRPDGTGKTPLMYAAATGQIEIAKLLRRAGAPMNPPAGSYDGLPVPEAVLHRHDKMLAWLLANGADANRGDWYGGGPIHMAAAKGYVSSLRILLQAGAKPDAQDIRGLTALHNAAEMGQTAVIPVLLNAGMNVDVRSGADNSPCGPDLTQTPHLETPLMLAAQSENADTVKMLLAKKADAKLVDADHRTALHMAVNGYGNKPEAIKQIVQALIEANTPINQEDADGHTALDIAKAQRLKDVAQLLQRHGAKPGSGKARDEH